MSSPAIGRPRITNVENPFVRMYFPRFLLLSDWSYNVDVAISLLRGHINVEQENNDGSDADCRRQATFARSHTL